MLPVSPAANLTMYNKFIYDYNMVTFFQACECHAFDVPSAEAHYRAVCRNLVEEAMTIHLLREEVEVDKKKEQKMSVCYDDIQLVVHQCTPCCIHVLV